MNDKNPARRKRKNLFRQIAMAVLILAGTFLATLLAVPRFIVVPTPVPSPAPTALADLPGRTSPAGGRGNIYDRRFREMAVSLKAHTILAHPRRVGDIPEAASRLAAILEIDPDRLARVLRSTASSVTLARHIDPARAAAVAALGIPGLDVREELVRFYPRQGGAAHLLGYVEEDKGLDGLEFQYNTLLRAGKTLTGRGRDKEQPAGGGAHLVLSVDIDIQTMVEKQLHTLLAASGAEGATALLLDPRDGAVLALASAPAFDPNLFAASSDTARRNRVLTDRLPLGSLGNIFQFTAALERDLRESRKPSPEADPEVVVISPPQRKRTLAVGRLELTDELLADLAGRLGFGTTPPLDLPVFNREGGRDGGREEGRDEGRDEGGEGGSAAAVPAHGPIPFRPDSAFRATILELTVAMAELVNGGQRVVPRLLAGVHDRNDGRSLPLPPDAGNISAPFPVLEEGVSEALLELLPRLGRTGPGEALYFESLTPEPPAKAEIASAAQLARALQHRVDGGEQLHALVFGCLPATHPEMILVMALHRPDPARFKAGRNQPSPLLAAARQLLPRAGERSRETAARSFAEALHHTEVTPLTHWKIEQYPAIATAMARESEPVRMPEVLGKSLRNGLQILQHYDLRIRVVGTGRIVHQHPPADTLLAAGEECVLELNLDN